VLQKEAKRENDTLSLTKVIDLFQHYRAAGLSSTTWVTAINYGESSVFS
jgi:hypothetical protein